VVLQVVSAPALVPVTAAARRRAETAAVFAPRLT
jgi:hypothetical protein